MSRGPQAATAAAPASNAATAATTTTAPLVFCGNMPQNRASPASSSSSSSASATPASFPASPDPSSSSSGTATASAAIRGHFIVQSDVPSPASPPPESLVRLKREEQARLDELDAQLKRVFAQSSSFSREPGPGALSRLGAAASSAGGAVLSGNMGGMSASAAGSAVVQYALGSTLLPQGIADLISNISLLARVSLKCSAFFIEVLIEAARLSTGAGLGITRRALISAVASARNVSSLASNVLPNGLLEGPPNDQAAMKALSKTIGPANHAFLTVLDRYTSLGIYMIHHTFTLAELFAMSGFYLTSTGIKMGIGAADESVRMLDQIFGSNETSRALSSFITLARRELGDDGVTGTGGITGTVKTIAYLTKAITAFAVLQNMTHRRTFAEQKLKVIYDCTVLGEAETNSWRAKLWGVGNFVPARKTSLIVGAPTSGDAHQIFSLLAPGGEVGAVGSGPEAGSLRSQRQGRPTSYLSTRSGEQPCITSFDLRSDPSGVLSSPSGDPDETEDTIMADLNYYVGGDEDEEDDEVEDALMRTSGDGASQALVRRGAGKNRERSKGIISAKRMRPAELTEEMRMVLKHHGDRELENGVIVSQETEPRGRREVRRTMRKMINESKSGAGGGGGGEVVFEMITEIVETTETTTTVEARTPVDEKPALSLSGAAGDKSSPTSNGRWGKGFSRQGKGGSGAAAGPTPSSSSSSPQRKASFNNWLPSVFQPLKAGEKRTERDVTNTRSAVDTESIYDDRVERTRMEEDTWCEISTSSQAARDRDRDQRQQLSPQQFGGALQRLSSVGGLELATAGPIGSASASGRPTSFSEEEVERELVLGEIPTMPNGAPATAVGTVALRDSLEHPDQSKARMQVVLKTMTKKLVQRKRILRKITVKNSRGVADGHGAELEEDEEDVGLFGDERRFEDEEDVAVGMWLEADSDVMSAGARTPASQSGFADDGLRSTDVRLDGGGAGLGLNFASATAGGGGLKGKQRAREIEYASSPASSEGARTPRGAVPGPGDGGRKAGAGSTFQRALGRARDAVRSTSRSASLAPNGISRAAPAANPDSSDVSMESIAPKDKTAGAGPKSPIHTASRLLSPAPTVPTRARNNISATATPITNGSSISGPAAPFGNDAFSGSGSVSQRGSLRKGKRASRSAFGVPFLGAQYDPSVDGSGSAAGTTTTNGLLHSPPMISSRRHSRAPSVTSVHSFTSRTHTHTNTTAHNSPYLNNPESTVHGRGYGGGASGSGNAGRGTAHPSALAPELGPNFPGEPAGEMGNAYYPHSHLAKNLHRFMRHSSAAYGQNFMRIFGIGQADYFFPDTSKHHANVWSFAHHVGLDVDKILLSSFTEGGTGPFHSDKMSPLVNYVSVDDESEAIVFTCRGTLGLSDILTDLTCTYEPIPVQGGNPDCEYKVHAGMLHSARLFRAQSSTVFSTIRIGLEENPDYGLILAGHSLGGGVCTVLAVLWSVPAPVFLRQIEEIKAKGLEPPRFPPITTPFVTSLTSGLPPGRPIHTYAYGPPATATADLSHFCRGLVTSLAHGYDMVPFFSLGALRDLKNVAKSLAEERETDVAQEIVARTIGLLQHKRQHRQGSGSSIDAGASAHDRPRLPPSTPVASITAADLAGFNEDSMSQAQPIAEERLQAVDLDELTKGRTANRANRPGYRDPNLSRQPADDATDATTAIPSLVQDEVEADAELNQWLWAVIKTMRADMKEEKLYPPGHVYCIESFAVFVTPRMSRSSAHSRKQDYDRLAASKGQAHRVVLRYCEDVEKRFSEIVWSMSMLRDHIPTNYEFCTQLLCESILPDDVDAPGQR
ncbi:hypothetical protein OC835_002634 [Tilletia horrida]|nr:hypothetical protein OC835_002634 [Tilletia horrida]